MYAFELHQPTELADAVARFRAADDPAYLAGGHTLIPTLKQRLASPSDLIDLAGVEDVQSIPTTTTRSRMRAGPSTSWRTMTSTIRTGP